MKKGRYPPDAPRAARRESHASRRLRESDPKIAILPGDQLAGEAQCRGDRAAEHDRRSANGGGVPDSLQSIARVEEQLFSFGDRRPGRCIGAARGKPRPRRSVKVMIAKIKIRPRP
jgi:hypothetical protein